MLIRTMVQILFLYWKGFVIMNNNIQRVILLTISCGLMCSINADYGRSPLIEFVIQQENEITKIQQDVQALTAKKEVVGLRQRYIDLEQCIEMTLHDIEVMSDTGALFDVVDDFGYTALNYCQTEEIFLKLRLCGMPFQYDAWLYIYRYECCIAVAGLATLVVVSQLLGNNR